MRKFLKNWGPLAVAIIAVVASVCAIYLDNAHFDKALKSQQASDARHDEQFVTAMSKAGEANELAGEANELAGEATGLAGKANELAGEANDATEKHYQELKLSDMLSMLHIRLNDQREWLNEIPDDFNLPSAQQNHEDATNNWFEAQEELLAGNLDRTQELIKDALVSLKKCYSAAEGRMGKEQLPPKPVWIGEEEETY